MHIFVDESGNFRPLNGAESRFSCIAAIAVASDRKKRLYREYARLRTRLFPTGGEPKGSRLSEAEARQILELLVRHDVVLDACLIDAGIHHVDEIQEFQAIEADSLVAHLDPGAQPERYVQAMTQAGADVARLSPQLFTQCWAMVVLIHRLMQMLTLHFVRRQPRELSRFHWDVDPKDITPTVYEGAWKGLILPLIAELTKRQPIVMTKGGDYTCFARFEKPVPEEAFAGLAPGKAWERKAVDTEALLEELEFPRSEDCPGVQLADMAASVLCRAFNGNMGREGWISLAPLLATDAEGRPFRLLRMVGSSGVPRDPRDLHPRQRAIMDLLAASARWPHPRWVSS